MFNEKSKPTNNNSPLEEEITNVHDYEYMEDEELSLTFETDDEEEDNWLTSSQESANEEDAELNNILCTTLEKVNKFIEDQLDKTKTTFESSIENLLANMSPENRARAEDRILFYLVKCKLRDMNGEGIDNLKI